MKIRKEKVKKEKIIKNKKQRAYKKSFKFQVTLIFVAVMAGTLLTLWATSFFLLEPYYIREQQHTLENLYVIMSDAATAGTLESEDMDLELQTYCGTHNVSVAIISSIFEPVRIYSNEPQEIMVRDMRSRLTGSWTVDEIIDENEQFIMVRRHDSRLNMDNIEMMGSLADGSFFMSRITVESIRNSTSIFSHFLLYIGIGAMIVSSIIIYLVTRRVSKPILDLAKISEKVSAMDFSARYTGKGHNEIALLGNNINNMSENLEKAILELTLANEQLKEDIGLKERIDEMRKEFISNVSHELKTPIALIQGYSEGLKECVNEPEEMEYYCDVIIDEATKLNKMVKQLTNLNQLEAGYYALELTDFNIMELIRNYVQSAEILTKQKDISVKVAGPDSLMVYADEFKAEEAFMNFFSNAINHCESDTQKSIDVTVEKNENKVVVNVFNTGNCIPEESIEHLWEKFYKVDKARTRAYGGSGVGLSIVKAIAEAHGCECGVENRAGGVNFWITFNLSDNTHEEVEDVPN